MLDLSFTYARIGDAFDPSLGFVPRRAMQQYRLGAAYERRPSWSWLRTATFETFATLITDLQGRWESYRVFTAPVNLRFESGDGFEVNVVPTGDRFSRPFEIGGVTVPAGEYRWIRYRVELRSADKRPLGARVEWWFGGFYGGTLHQVQGRVRYSPNALLNLEAGLEHNAGRLPSGAFTLDLATLRIGLNLSPDLQVSSLVQYDNESRLLGTNTRLRWTFRPQGELFVIYDWGIRDLQQSWRNDLNRLSVKVRYTLRR